MQSVPPPLEPDLVMEITRGGSTFRVTRGPHDWLWAKYGTWEPETIQVFDRFIGPETTVLDVGAWIGPTVLYAARRARRVVAFEPDPTAYGMLAANLAANPDIRNVELHQACLATEEGEVRLGIDDRPGDAQSSILFGSEGPGWTVSARRLDRVIAERRIERPLFIKMDIEGYEFELVPAILDTLREPGTIMHLSTHVLAFRDRKARLATTRLARSVRKRLFGRLPAVKAFRRLADALDGRVFVYDEQGRPVRLRSRLPAIALRRGPTASGALVISAEPLTWDAPPR